MAEPNHLESIKLFFQTFSNHLRHIRDDSSDANQAFRAQILLGQLQQFEKAVAEMPSAGDGDGETFVNLRDLLGFNCLEDLLHWLGSQAWVRLAAVFYIEGNGQWSRLLGAGDPPEKLRVETWLQRGRLGRLLEKPSAYVIHVYGQPRLVLQFDPEMEGGDIQGLTAGFLARLAPLFIKTPVQLPRTYALAKQGIIARDGKFLEQLTMIERAARKDVSILLEGESGTGKEVIADFIHRHSPRAKQPFVAVNCAAIPAGLIESELFGHEQGSFTSATARKTGRVEEADGGTLFLDEIGEMELALQAKMLRFLQLKEFHRVGGKRKISVNVRIIAATNRNIKEQVAKGAFREDLYYRLAVMPFMVAPLRDRVDDIIPLAHYFLEKYAKDFGGVMPEVDPMVYQLLAAYDYPGNVRELENIIQNVLVVCQGGTIRADHLPAPLLQSEPQGEPALSDSGQRITWRVVRRGTRTLRLRRHESDGHEARHLPWDRVVPTDNESLKALKQEIQDYANDLTLRLEKRFLDDLLTRADGSMPKASKLADINRTLLYKMIDRTKHLDPE